MVFTRIQACNETSPPSAGSVNGSSTRVHIQFIEYRTQMSIDGQWAQIVKRFAIWAFVSPSATNFKTSISRSVRLLLLYLGFLRKIG